MITERNPFPASRIIESRVRLGVGDIKGYLRPLHPRSVQVSFAGVERVIGLIQDEDLPGVPRLWFECPACRAKVRHLYAPEWACRRCLRLDYRCRHAGRWRSGRTGRWNLARIAQLRRRLNVDERPFAPIPPPPRRRGRWWRLTRQIMQEESKLVGDIQRFVEAAKRGLDDR